MSRSRRVGVLVAGVRAGTGDQRAGEDSDPGEREQQPGEAAASDSDTIATPFDAVGFTGTPDEHGPGHDQRHRQQQVTLDGESGGDRRGPRYPRARRSPATPTTNAPRQPRRGRGDAGHDAEYEPSTAAITATATTPVNSRLICSIAACFDDTSISRSLEQFGQSSQPSPLFVSRTAAPVTMITANATNAPMVIWRYRAARSSCSDQATGQPNGAPRASSRRRGDTETRSGDQGRTS